MTYTHGHHESVLRGHRWRTVENSAAYLLGELVPGSQVLDVGCGPGTITSDLASRVMPGRVIGIDQSPEVIDQARSLMSSELAGLSFDVGDVYHLSYDDATFDIVHAHQVLQHLEDPVAALAEMRRVCKPGGIVAVRDADYGAMVWFPDMPELERWRSLYRQIARQNGGEPDAGRALLSWASQVGFSALQPSASAWCFANDLDRAWWGGQWADRVQHSRFSEQALSSGIADDAELEALASAWRAWSHDPSGWFAVLHAEVLCRV
jgi:ubiquinone/menaquinone biosynthesis C-methylase UbiE